jgi:hypothetical protein
MNKDNMILAKDSEGTEIRVKDIKKYLENKDKEKLADCINDRLYGRYLKPFDYDAEDYKKEYKDGFVMMASCCLLVETYVSFINKALKDTRGKTPHCFKYFFANVYRFNMFNDNGVPHDFYVNVRCGILHNAETRNGWVITRDKDKPVFDKDRKEINATKFANRLKWTLIDYSTKLKLSDFDNDEIWKNFRERLDFLFENL